MKFTQFTILSFSLFLSAIASANPLQLPSVFSDHMVLQRETKVNIWGKGAPESTVQVDFSGQIQTTNVDANGNWILQLEPMDANKTPQTLTVQSGQDVFSFQDVLVGDVWLCSGQSNMEWPLANTTNGDMEVASAEKPFIRLYQVDRITVQEPRFSGSNSWQRCNSETVGSFSAVGYQFGKNIQPVVDVPIGLIDSSWGGTPIVAWIQEETLLTTAHTRKQVEKWNHNIDNFDVLHAKWEVEMDVYAKENNIIVTNVDSGISEEAAQFHLADFDDSSWESVSLPRTIERHSGNVDGAFWYRLKVDLPKSFQNTSLQLSLGPVDDLDITFVNDEEVGSHMNSADKPYSIPRIYTIPASLNKASELTIAVRVFDEVADGGFTGSAAMMKLETPSGETISLAQSWRFKAEASLQPAVGAWNVRGPEEPQGAASPNRPGILANSMLTPVCPFTLKGAIWYQGESDTDWLPDLYENRLELMLSDWETRWGQEQLPLGIVQLANYMEPSTVPVDGGWPRVRDSQFRLAKAKANVGLAVLIDIGETNDIHPLNKQDVGRRLSRWALTDIYGKLQSSGGPIYDSHKVVDEGIEITFSNAGRGLKVKNGGALKTFTIAGKDRVFVPAEATIVDDNKIWVKSSEIQHPVAVRYAWSNNPIDANLINLQRLPASPFRTDDWPMSEE